jgi:hypothetical protein
MSTVSRFPIVNAPTVLTDPIPSAVRVMSGDSIDVLASVIKILRSPENVHVDPHLIIALAFVANTKDLIFAYTVTMSLIDAEFYSAFKEFEGVTDLTIIVHRCKRIQSCLGIVRSVCLGNLSMGQTVLAPCPIMGSSNKDVVRSALGVVIAELDVLDGYEFYIILHGVYETIYGFVIQELMDIGDGLQPYVDELTEFIYADVDDYTRYIRSHDLGGDTWIHQEIRSLASVAPPLYSR